MSLREFVDKASSSNVAALVVVVGTVGYGIYYRDPELLKLLVVAAAGYLWRRENGS